MERFWNKLSPPDENGCRKWTAHLNTRGYGKFRLNGHTKLSHRVAYELTYGPIPDNLDVLHHCDNPACCEPIHLFLGEHQDNMDDMKRKGRQSRLPGELNGGAKLTNTQRQSIAQDTRARRIIALEYGISPRHVNKIKQQERLRCLPSSSH